MNARWNGLGVDRLTSRGFDQAKLAGHRTMGSEHLLAALLTKSTDTREALEAAGLRHGPVLEVLRSRHRVKSLDDESIHMGPTAHEALAFASGLALALGADRVDDVHLLHGVLFVDSTPIAQVIQQLDLRFDRLIEELRARRILLVDRDPPKPFDPGPLGPRIYVAEEHAKAAFRALNDARAIERGFWGWNMSRWRPGHRAIDAEWVVDAVEILAAALPADAIEIVDFDEALAHEFAAKDAHPPREPRPI